MDSIWNLWNYVEYVESTWNLWGSVKYTLPAKEIPGGMTRNLWGSVKSHSSTVIVCWVVMIGWVDLIPGICPICCSFRVGLKFTCLFNTGQQG